MKPTNLGSLITQVSNIDTVSLCLLKKIYSLYKKQYWVPMPMDYLVKHTPEYTDEELKDSLNKLHTWQYLDVSEDELFITEAGIWLVEGNRKLKAASIIAEAVVAIAVIGFFISTRI